MKDIHVSLRNLGTVNKNAVTIATDKGQVDLYFSYSTLVAVNGTVSKNIWSVTTGKLLNELQPNKKARVDHEVVLKTAANRLDRIL